jgi:hypothetical protein
MNSVNPPGLLRRLLLVSACFAPLAAAPLVAQEAQAASATSSNDDEIVTLSPFEVVSDTRGYYGANTMSGTRFNTRIEDLASAVTIVTKEQMNDFAMLDLNDVFLYTVGTEGTGTYTDVTIDRNGSVSDNVQLNPTQANRVRGLSSANIAFNNIAMQNRMPIDPTIIDALEISRGPNASVFGLGNPSGTVNQVAASANLTRDRIQVQLRADDWDGYRESVDVNQVIMKDKLAVRASQVFQHDESVRKPSGFDSERYNVMAKYRPFTNTTITAGYYGYHAYGNRANSLPPRDGISYWLNSGKPTWDPVTRTITVDGGKILDANGNPRVYGASNGNYNGPDYFSSGWLGGNHSQVFINENGDITNWVGPTGISGTGTIPPAGVNPSGPGVQPNRFLQPTPMAGITSSTGKGAQGLFLTVPSLVDRSLYDPFSVNVSAPNYVWDKDEISTVQVDQIFVNTARQTLAAQVAFMREESERFQRNFIGIANDLGLSGVLTIDVNENLLDGTPNPYFLRPYISTDKPRTTYSPWRWDTYRGQAAYRFDFTQEKNWLRWLGVHQVTGYGEYKYRVSRNYSYRDVIANNLPWIESGVYRGNQSQVGGTPSLIATTQSNFRYYVGDATGNNVDYAPSQFSYGTYDYVWGNAQTGVFNHEQATLGLGASTDSTGGVNNQKRILKTLGGVLQSRFFNDSLITTIGIRQDEVYDIFGNKDSAQMMNPDGLTFNYAGTDAWETTTWERNYGRTTNYQVVARPFKELPTFQNMRGFWGDLLTDLSIGYNQSDSFLPEEPAQDLFLNKLPNSTGEDKSWTARINLMDGKLIISATRYKDTVYNTRNGDANVINQRVLRHDLPIVGATPARFLLWDVAGSYTESDNRYNHLGWIHWEHPDWTPQQVQAELYNNVLKITPELAAELIDPTLPLRATNDIEARGTEIEVNYNPNSYWTVAAAWEESEAINRNISGAVQKWIDMRMPIWTSLKDPSIPDADAIAEGNPDKLWWKHIYPGASGTGLTPEVNFESFVRQPYAVIKALEGQANPQYSKYKARVSTNYRLAGITDHPVWKKFNVGGAVRWQSKASIGYYGVQELPAVITDVDVSRPIWGDDAYYFDAFVGYRTKLFNDKVDMTVQLNVQNIQESGSLRALAAYPNGVPHTFRIIDPRKFILTATFEL